MALAQSALEFVQLAQVFEDFSCRGRRLVMSRFVLSLTQQAAQMLAVGLRIDCQEGFQIVIAAAEQPVAPTLQGVEALVVFTGRSIDLINEGEDGRNVLLTHQLADVLHVALLRHVGGVLGRIGQGAAQRFGDRQTVLQLRLEAGQALTQLLQRVQLTLDLGFALLFGEVVVEFGHGAHPVDNAAMITAACTRGLPAGRRDG